MVIHLAALGPLRVYLDWRDWWIGYYRAENYHYVCPLPCLVVRWARRGEGWRNDR